MINYDEDSLGLHWGNSPVRDETYKILINFSYAVPNEDLQD
jgi:hypothetical protein